MRLIDAEEFKKQIAGMAIANNYPADKANKMCELIDCQPTAYDVDKVVERLEKMRDTITNNISLNSQESDVDAEILRETEHYQRIIQIVQSGGIE